MSQNRLVALVVIDLSKDPNCMFPLWSPTWATILNQIHITITVPKNKIGAEDLNHQYIMTSKWSQTIDTLHSADMRVMVSLIEKHSNHNAGTVKWVHPRAFYFKANSDDNSLWY